VGVAARVDHDRVAARARALDRVDQPALVVRLRALDGDAARVAAPHQLGVDLGERGRPVDQRIARAEQVEVGAVQDQQLCHGERAAIEGRECGPGDRCPDVRYRIGEVVGS
jgi:hypothetical protein